MSSTQISVRNLKNFNYLIVIKSIQLVNVSAPTVGEEPRKLIAICVDGKSRVDCEDMITEHENGR
jgi:hypothetical protein